MTSHRKTVMLQIEITGRIQAYPDLRRAAIPKVSGQAAVTRAVMTVPATRAAADTRGKARSGDSFSQFRRRMKARRACVVRIPASAPHV